MCPQNTADNLRSATQGRRPAVGVPRRAHLQGRARASSGSSACSTAPATYQAFLGDPSSSTPISGLGRGSRYPHWPKSKGLRSQPVATSVNFDAATFQPLGGRRTAVRGSAAGTSSTTSSHSATRRRVPSGARLSRLRSALSSINAEASPRKRSPDGPGQTSIPSGSSSSCTS